MKQIIDFTKPIPHKENNPESQDHFQGQMKKFSSQCKTVYDALLRGEKLTTLTAMVGYGIGDLRRRIKDLKDIHKINIKDRWVTKNGSRFKEFYVE